MTEADQNRLLRRGEREPRRMFRRLDHRGEIAVLHVDDSGEFHQPGGEDPAAVAFARLLDTVGGHQDGPWKRIELLHLVLPCAAVIADQVLVLLEPRISVGGKHLAVSINVDSGPLGLLEQRFEIIKIVPGDENRLARHRSDANRRRFGPAEPRDVSFVQDFHRPQILFAAFQRKPDQPIQRRLGIMERRQRLGQKRVAAGIGPAKPPGVMQIRGHPLKSVKQKFLRRGDFRTQFLPAKRIGVFRGQLFQPRHVLRDRPVDCRGDPANHGGHFFRVEIHIGDRGKQPVGQHRRIDLLHRRLFQELKQQILNIGAVRRLAAYSLGSASGATRRLFALKAEHLPHFIPPR